MEVLSSFGVEWKLLVASMINFIILLYLLNKILYRPLLRTLDERKTKIAESLANADTIEKKLVETEAREREILQKARLEAQHLLQKAEEHAKSREIELLKQAEEQARLVMTRAEEKMEHQAEAMRKDIEQNVADLIVTTTKMILEKRMPQDITKDYATKMLEVVKK